MELVVIVPFNGHERGTVLTDDAEIEAVLAGENACNVVKRIKALSASEA